MPGAEFLGAGHHSSEAHHCRVPRGHAFCLGALASASGAPHDHTGNGMRGEYRDLDRADDHSESRAARVSRGLAWLRNFHCEAAPRVGQPARGVERVSIRATLGARDGEPNAALLHCPLFRRCHE